MKIHLKFLLPLLFLISCKNQNPPLPPQSTEHQNTIALHTHADTIFTPHAPAVITRNILQDNKGNIWLATFEGIIQYDGHTFTNQSKEISKHRFFSLIQDRKGVLWFGSIGDGVFRYDGMTFQHLTTDNGLVNNEVTNIYEAQNGDLWFGTTNGVSIYDGKTFKNLTSENGLPYNDINAIKEDDEGVFWLGSREYAFTYDGSKFVDLKNEQGDRFGNVRHIIKDSKGHIWLGGKDGLWRYDGTGYKRYSSDFVGYIYEDKIGNIWTSSEGFRSHGWELSRYESNSLEDKTVIPIIVKSGDRMLFGILEDAEGAIWIGTLAGVYQYKGDKITIFQPSNINSK